MFNKMFNALRDVCSELGEAAFEVADDFIYCFKRTLIIWVTMLDLICPYLMWWLAAYLYNERGEFAIGGEIFIPILFMFVSNVLKNIAIRHNEALSFPVPRKRFTRNDGNGEYSVEQNRIQEMILYVADVEEYLERKGMIK